MKYIVDSLEIFDTVIVIELYKCTLFYWHTSCNISDQLIGRTAQQYTDASNNGINVSNNGINVYNSLSFILKQFIPLPISHKFLVFARACDVTHQKYFSITMEIQIRYIRSSFAWSGDHITVIKSYI